MTAPPSSMNNYIIRQRAADDLEDIWLYTFKEWGQTQADYYLRNIIARIEWLAQNPYLGKQRADISSEYFCYPEGKHHIFYIIDTQIEVIGIPHQQMDVVRYFE